MQVNITISGPAACGKTVLADKIADLIRCEALPSQNIDVVIREHTGPAGEVSSDRRYIRETSFHV